MSDGGLHEVSTAIGELRAEVKTLFHKHDDMAARIDERLTEIDRKVTRDADDLKALKAKGAGILIGLALASAAMGAWMSDKAHALATLILKG